MSLPWTERFKPKTLPEIAGNYSAAEHLLRWVQARLQGRVPKKAALLHGPPGTGKTLAVELVARSLDLELLEMNASDFRTEQLVGRVAGGAALQAPLFGRKGKLIFLDEVDGISGREDRGGLSKILELIRESPYPIVLAVNDPWDPRYRALRDLCEMIQFRRVGSPSIGARIRKIARDLGIAVEDEAVKRLAESSGGDLRAAINDFQMLAEGKSRLAAGDIRLYLRSRERGAFEVMRDLFSAQTCIDAKRAADMAAIDTDMLFQWINENIPNQYTDMGERSVAYDWLSRADLFMSRVKRKQMWDLLGYAVELAACGAALAKRGEYRYTRYTFPRRISMMSGTKEARAKEKERLTKLSGEVHASRRKIATEYLPYMKMIDEAGGWGEPAPVASGESVAEGGAGCRGEGRGRGEGKGEGKQSRGGGGQQPGGTGGDGGRAGSADAGSATKRRGKVRARAREGEEGTAANDSSLISWLNSKAP